MALTPEGGIYDHIIPLYVLVFSYVEWTCRFPPLSHPETPANAQQQQKKKTNQVRMELVEKGRKKNRNKKRKEGVGYVQQAENPVPDLFRLAMCKRMKRSV